MATIGELNIRIGARIRGLEQGLRRSEALLRRSSRRFRDIGQTLTTNITLPIAAIGGAALNQFAKIELLENGLSSMMGGAEEARKEMELLRAEALKPGLGFEQAVRGSVRLQAVGLDADLARKALANFGNAIALAGGTASDLDGVSLALTQIISKGKISAEEINQLAERVPQVRKAIKDAFGTSDSEELQKLGVSAEDFVEKVIGEMGKLPTAVGGLSNAFQNTGQAITNFLADIGKDINKTFDIQGKVNEFSATLDRLTQRFSNLSPEAKKMVLVTSGLAAAIGPLALGVSALINTYSRLKSIGLLLQLNFVKLQGHVSLLTARFLALKAAQMATIVGLAVAAVGLAVLAWKSWNSEMSSTEKATKSLKDATLDINKEFATEKTNVDNIFKALKDANTPQAERNKLISDLTSMYPGYLSEMDIEALKAGNLETAHKKLNDSILKGLAARKKAEAQSAVLEKQLNAQLRIQELLNGAEVTVSDLSGADVEGIGKKSEIRQKVLEKLKSQVVELGKEAEIVGKKFDDAFGIGEKKRGTGRRIGGTSLADLKDDKVKKPGGDSKIKLTSDELERFNSLVKITEANSLSLGLTVDNLKDNSIAKIRKEFADAQQPINAANDALINLANNVLKAGANGFDALGLSAKGAIEQIGKLPMVEVGLSALQERMMSINESFTSFRLEADNIVNAGLVDAFTAVGEAIGNMGGKMKDVFKTFGGAMFDIIASILIKLGKAALATAFGIKGILESLKTLQWQVALGAGVALIALGTLMKGKVKKLAGFADGGFTPGGPIIVGERGPEILSPPKGSFVTPNHMMGGGGPTQVTGEFKIRGTDLVVVLDEVNRQRGRMGL